MILLHIERYQPLLRLQSRQTTWNLAVFPQKTGLQSSEGYLAFVCSYIYTLYTRDLEILTFAERDRGRVYSACLLGQPLSFSSSSPECTQALGSAWAGMRLHGPRVEYTGVSVVARPAITTSSAGRGRVLRQFSGGGMQLRRGWPNY